jgi:hypothetical protein
MFEETRRLRIDGKIPGEDMKKFVDALKLSIRQNQNRSGFFKYMKRYLGPDAKKWQRVIEGNRMALGEITRAHITKGGEVVFSDDDLKHMFTQAHGKEIDLDFLLDFVEFLKKNRQDALELKKGL